MSECKLLINDFEVVEGEIALNTALLCTYDPHVLSPKVKIIFEADGEIRRLPFPVTSYFKRRESEDAVIICNYTFSLDLLFYHYEPKGEIKAHIELYYGSTEYTNIPLFVSKGLAEKCADDNIPENYIAGDSFMGLVSYGSVNGVRTPWFGKSDYVYECRVNAEDCCLVFNKSLSPDAQNRSELLAKLCKGVFAVINLFVCIMLLPYLVFEGIFSGLGLLPKRKYRPVEGTAANIIAQIKTNLSAMLKTLFKSGATVAKLIKPSKLWFSAYYKKCCKKPIVQNRVAFLSCRRDEFSGNEKFVYDILKDEKDIDFKYLFFSDVTDFNIKKNIKKFVELYATSKVVIVDDFYNLLNVYPKREGVTLFQLWHACGAFKTFGFSRLAKKSGPTQANQSHRMYDYATVSSSEIVKYYAEGFGISDKHVVPTGVPRTDIFMDDEYAENIKTELYGKHPQLKGKKVVLFAPTFRGDDKASAFYPLDAFDPQKFIDTMGDDTVMIIKLHPFCKQTYVIDETHQNKIFDFSDNDELNDLLFITDLLITDYSSVVFEASLLNIPMLFYAFDLYEYISDRDFYCDFIDFVPGKICYNQAELIAAAVSNNCEKEKVEPFRKKYFEHFDGKSSQRVADLILKELNMEKKPQGKAEKAEPKEAVTV